MQNRSQYKKNLSEKQIVNRKSLRNKKIIKYAITIPLLIVVFTSFILFFIIPDIVNNNSYGSAFSNIAKSSSNTRDSNEITVTQYYDLNDIDNSNKKNEGYIFLWYILNIMFFVIFSFLLVYYYNKHTNKITNFINYRTL
jgi:hypothetical protein